MTNSQNKVADPLHFVGECCKDKAVIKMHVLVTGGLPTDDMYFCCVGAYYQQKYKVNIPKLTPKLHD
jgi:hypothetical protein